MQECVSKLHAASCPAYSDGPQALYILKLMMIKMAHKDWTAIDRQWIATQAKQTRNSMHAVTHFGCEGYVTDSGIVQCPTPLSLPSGSTSGVPRTGDPRCLVCPFKQAEVQTLQMTVDPNPALQLCPTHPPPPSIQTTSHISRGC